MGDRAGMCCHAPRASLASFLLRMRRRAKGRVSRPEVASRSIRSAPCVCRRTDIPSRSRLSHLFTRNTFQLALLGGTFLFAATVATAADEWHFVVKNGAKSKITALQVSQDNSKWGAFDVGSGIAVGETATMVWAKSTDGENCDQWIRAKFSDGSFSEASKQNFCEDLDSPIEFSE
jgi:hypothetical protein